MSDEEIFDLTDFENDDTHIDEDDDSYELHYDTSICGKPDTFSYYDNCFR